MTIPILSFFTGGGLLDIGFEQEGFHVVWTNEINEQFADIYSVGMTAWKKQRGCQEYAQISNGTDVVSLSRNKILKEAFGGVAPRFWGMIGGPPCPDFSRGGNHAGGEGKNGYLTGVYVDKIGELNPDFFLLENVAGLYRFQKHRAYLFEQMEYLYQKKYVLDYTVLDALDYGVPQTRERFFLIGFKRDVAKGLLARNVDRSETGWFPWPKPKYQNAKHTFRWPAQSRFRGLPKCPSGIPQELTVWHAFNIPLKSTKVANGDEYFQPYSKKFQEIMEGDVSGHSFKRLHRYRFSPTAWYGNREVHLHPYEARRISVREAMRIQTMPEEYIIPKEICLSAKFKMIANGVPCLLAGELARAIGHFASR